MTPIQKATKFNSIVERAAKYWTLGNNSGDPETLANCEKRCQALQDSAIAFLPPNTAIDWPGLYPRVQRAGKTWHGSVDKTLWELDNP